MSRLHAIMTVGQAKYSLAVDRPIDGPAFAIVLHWE